MIRLSTISKTVCYFLPTLSLLVTSTASISGQSLQPTSCVQPAIATPAPLVQTPANPTLPEATTINVLLEGATGNGTTIDSTAIQSVIDKNPDGVIYFPSGTYRLHNDSFNQPGLLFADFHGTAVMQQGARFVCDTETANVAGQCIYISDSSNATFDNFRVGYTNESILPLSRADATNNAILVEDSSNITLNNTTVEASTGSGIWVTGSTSVSFLGGTSVSNTAADGLHFENDANAVVNGYTSHITGDDALSATNESTGTVNCGLTASNIQIYDSLSRGISVPGACGSSFSNFYINTTANSGIGVAQDPNFATLVPKNTTFNNGVVINSGRYSSTVVSGKDCIDIAESDNTSVSNVSCIYPLIDGVFIDGNATEATISGVTVSQAPNVGFQATSATHVEFLNTISRGSLGGGYGLQDVNEAWVQGAVACSSGGYGFYHQGTTNVTELNLTAYDSSEGNSSNRAWWAEIGSGNIGLSGIDVLDDKTTEPVVLGGATNTGPVTISGEKSDILHSSLLLQLP